MKKNILLTLLALSTLVFTSAPAHAMFWQSAKVATPKTYTIAGVGQYYYDPSKFMGYLDFVAGIDPRLSLEARLGDGGYEFYAGAFAKYAALTTELMQFSLFGGLYTQGNGYVEVAPIATFDIGRADFYFGPDFALSLGDRSLISTFNVGISIPYEYRLAIFAEFDFKLNKVETSTMAGIRGRF